MDYEMEVARLRDLVNSTIDNLRDGTWPKDEVLCSLETGLYEIDRDKAVAKAEAEQVAAHARCACGHPAYEHIARRYPCTHWRGCDCQRFGAATEVARG